jgi:hypothetical protein
MADIAQEFQCNFRKFELTAREWTEKFATKVPIHSIVFCVRFSASLYFHLRLQLKPLIMTLNNSTASGREINSEKPTAA